MLASFAAAQQKAVRRQDAMVTDFIPVSVDPEEREQVLRVLNPEPEDARDQVMKPWTEGRQPVDRRVLEAGLKRLIERNRRRREQQAAAHAAQAPITEKE